LTEIFARKAAADRVLSAWGKAHRFAGSKDRAAIAARVYTVLRRRNECAFRMQSDDARALVVASLSIDDGLGLDAIAALSMDGSHALGALSEAECAQLATPQVSSDPWVLLNYPEWLHPQLAAAFGDRLEREMRALNERAPLDLRVNAVKASREDVLRELAAASIEAVPLPNTTHGLRVAAGVDAKVTALAGYSEGKFEVQDEASQRAVALANVRPGETVIDLAAGAGGKALALASAMANSGRVIVCDIDAGRLRHSEPRIARSGATIVEQAGNPYGAAVSGADVVFVDAPCSGSGTWRRNPEAKWTLDAARLETYRQAQVQLLNRAAEMVGPGGRLVFAVCSILPSERLEQVDAFLKMHPACRLGATLDLTPARDGTDGFFAARLVPA
jgi:16S rRNA (cytosine967-C5)-methyltransferase